MAYRCLIKNRTENLMRRSQIEEEVELELRRELLTRTAEDYASARKGIKSQIVDQLVATTGYGRKHAITLLNNPPSRPDTMTG